MRVPKQSGRNPSESGLDRVLRAAVRHDFPVNILCWGNLDAGTALIDRTPTRDSSSTIGASCSRAGNPARVYDAPGTADCSVALAAAETSGSMVQNFRQELLRAF